MKEKYIISISLTKTQAENIAYSLFKIYRKKLKKNDFNNLKIELTPNNKINVYLKEKLIEIYKIFILKNIMKINSEDMTKINKEADGMFQNKESSYAIGVKDPDTLSAIMHNVYMEYVDSKGDIIERNEGIIKKAASLWYKIATSQVFFNGNKRTALLSSLALIYSNGFEWIDEINGLELYNITCKIANKQMNEEELVDYISNNTVVTIFNSLDTISNFKKIDTINVNIIN